MKFNSCQQAVTLMLDLLHGQFHWPTNDLSRR
jgi:hypothetical protein